MSDKNIDLKAKSNSEEWLEYLMFNLGLLFIALISAPLHQQQLKQVSIEEYNSLFILVAIIWLSMILEFIITVLTAEQPLQFFKANTHRLLPLIFPPTRMAIPAWNDKQTVWLPKTNWKKKNRALEKRVEKAFSLPMFLISILVLVTIGIELLAKDFLVRYQFFGYSVFIIQCLIWVAFVVEFIISIMITKKKLAYCMAHWLEIIIILLPTLAFFRFLRILQVLRISKVARSMRLRSVIIKAIPALLLFEHKYHRRYHPEDHRIRLQKRIKKAEDQLNELKEELESLDKTLLKNSIDKVD